MLKKYLFYIYILVALGGLIYVSLSTVTKDNAIVAIVESQKTAISYQKAVSIKAIHVIEGQQVKEGDLLIEVDRPDLNFDYEKLLNQKKQEESALLGINSEYRSDLELINIESSGKLSRINAEIAQLEAKIQLNQALLSDLKAMGNGSKSNQESINPDSILLQSYLTEKQQIESHYASERKRISTKYEQDQALLKLKIGLIEDEISLLDKERRLLKKYAPFDGTIGNVNAQLDEIVPSFQTIVSLYEQHPPTLKAFVNTDSPFVLTPGDVVDIESSNRQYNTFGVVEEVGARIVTFRDPNDPLTAPERYGREVFIRLPEDNTFLYGEQVYVFPKEN